VSLIDAVSISKFIQFGVDAKFHIGQRKIIKYKE
jgi:hypothetical protein